MEGTAESLSKERESRYKSPRLRGSKTRSQTSGGRVSMESMSANAGCDKMCDMPR